MLGYQTPLSVKRPQQRNRSRRALGKTRTCDAAIKNFRIATISKIQQHLTSIKSATRPSIQRRTKSELRPQCKTTGDKDGYVVPGSKANYYSRRSDVGYGDWASFQNCRYLSRSLPVYIS